MDSGGEPASVLSDTIKRSLSTRDSRPSSSAGSNKVFPKIGKLGTNTIEETTDQEQLKERPKVQDSLAVESKQLQLRRPENYDGGLIVQASNEREILAAVLEVKVDLKLEVQRVNQRLAKIEDMLQALMTRIPVAASPSDAGATIVQRTVNMPSSATAHQGPTSSQVPLFPSSTGTQGSMSSIAEQKTCTTPTNKE